MRQRLAALAGRAWDLHDRASSLHLSHLVRPSIPILYFGDSHAYGESEIKVVTVGLNPSLAEFPAGRPFTRFPGCIGLRTGDHGTYLNALDNYFRIAPYRRWFTPSFEGLLEGLGGSYYGGARSTALHTDLCSPLATDPTWSQLTPSERASLGGAAGEQLWHDLLTALEPDVVLISVARGLLGGIRFAIRSDPSAIHIVDGPERRRPYVIEESVRSLPSGKGSRFVFGQASQTPFGTISGVEKRAIGRLILGRTRGG